MLAKNLRILAASWTRIVAYRLSEDKTVSIFIHFRLNTSLRNGSETS